MPKLLLIDAFASSPFSGNPAAVVLLDHAAKEEWMQAVAVEMNQSETAFVREAEDLFGLRWFTPMTEIELCGHGTLAAAHALWETKTLKSDEPARFMTRSGLLTCTRQDDEQIAMDFPADPIEPADLPDELLDAFNIEDAPGVWRGRVGYVIELDEPGEVVELKPDFAALARINVEGFVVCAQGGPDGADFTSRYFAPRHGPAEDPVTGAAHCALGPLWALRFGRNEVTGYQASSRGGTVRVKVNGDRVTLIGRAVTVASGELHA